MGDPRPELGVVRSDLRVSRPAPHVTVTIRERFGHQIGDTREHRVTLSGDQIEIYNWSQSKSWTFKRDVAIAIRDALTQVLDWTDPEGGDE